MEPMQMSLNRLAAKRWLDESGSFSSEAVARAQDATQMTKASLRTSQVADVEHAFTRRCGRRDPVDKNLCWHVYGHEGRHAWEPMDTPDTGANGGSNMTEVFGGRKREEGPAVADTGSFSSDRIGDRTEVLTLNGKCDRSTALLAEQRIGSALASGTTEIILDLRGVTSLGRSMLQVLFRALIRMGRNGRLVLVRPNVHVWALFEESGLDKGFSTFPDLKGALAEVFVREPKRPSSPGLSSPGDLSGIR